MSDDLASILSGAVMPGDEASAFVRSQGVGVHEPTVTPYPETWRDRIAQGIAGDSQGGSYWRGVAERVMGSSGLGHTSIGGADIPPISGIFDTNDAWVKNDLNGVLLNGLGAALTASPLSKPAKALGGVGVFGAKTLNARPPDPINQQRE